MLELSQWLRRDQTSKQGNSGKTKHITLTIPQELEITGRLKSGESRRKVTPSYNIGSSSICDIKKWKD